MTKTWTCSNCGERDENLEWMSECANCGACSLCGEVLPTDDDPRKTYELRQPHRKTHE